MFLMSYLEPEQVKFSWREDIVKPAGPGLKIKLGSGKPPARDIIPLKRDLTPAIFIFPE
ncbi:hypothetical protein DCCM_4528 [Desulfocucumis palustris]|uniref:Uncharacterized protein n=1 Tax=Desulfocucumis palustris TaxID=1898651 RepID=A0A2L2XGS5_9FIRM|nr:hypothetical protein DCCM_4528 [Desulfocucumis palustris]